MAPNMRFSHDGGSAYGVPAHVACPADVEHHTLLCCLCCKRLAPIAPIILHLGCVQAGFGGFDATAILKTDGSVVAFGESANGGNTQRLGHEPIFPPLNPRGRFLVHEAEAKV